MEPPASRISRSAWVKSDEPTPRHAAAGVTYKLTIVAPPTSTQPTTFDPNSATQTLRPKHD